MFCRAFFLLGIVGTVQVSIDFKFFYILISYTTFLFLLLKPLTGYMVNNDVLFRIFENSRTTNKINIDKILQKYYNAMLKSTINAQIVLIVFWSLFFLNYRHNRESTGLQSVMNLPT